MPCCSFRWLSLRDSTRGVQLMAVAAPTPLHAAVLKLHLLKMKLRRKMKAVRRKVRRKVMRKMKNLKSLWKEAPTTQTEQEVDQEGGRSLLGTRKPRWLVCLLAIKKHACLDVWALQNGGLTQFDMHVNVSPMFV